MEVTYSLDSNPTNYIYIFNNLLLYIKSIDQLLELLPSCALASNCAAIYLTRFKERKPNKTYSISFLEFWKYNIIILCNKFLSIHFSKSVIVIWPTDPFQMEKHSAPPKCTLRAKSGPNLYPKTSSPKTLSTAQGDYQQLILTLLVMYHPWKS